MVYQKQDTDKHIKVYFASRTLRSVGKIHHEFLLTLVLALKLSIAERMDYLLNLKSFQCTLTLIICSTILHATRLRRVSELASSNFRIYYKPRLRNRDVYCLNRIHLILRGYMVSIPQNVVGCN